MFSKKVQRKKSLSADSDQVGPVVLGKKRQRGVDFSIKDSPKKKLCGSQQQKPTQFVRAGEIQAPRDPIGKPSSTALYNLKQFPGMEEIPLTLEQKISKLEQKSKTRPTANHVYPNDTDVAQFLKGSKSSKLPRNYKPNI